MTPDLSDADRTLLRRLADTDADAEALADDAGRPVETVESRLSRLVDDGLVRTTAEGTYAVTESGHRLLGTRADAPASDPDVPADVRLALASFDLRADAEDALRRSMLFLREWETATATDVVDGVYSEADAGYDDPDEWWNDLVRDRLAALPGVVPPADEGDRWRYDRDEDAAAPDATDDGRRVLEADGRHYGSARHAIDREADDDREAAALSAVLDALARDDPATAADLDRVAATATDGTVAFDDVADALATVPGVERDGEEWRYVPDDGGGSDAPSEQ